MERYLTSALKADLKRKMVFVGGARQVGKTTLGKSLLASPSGYLNWDVPELREKILKRELPHTSLWLFDELHKYKSWRNYLKGLFDVRAKGQEILVTGSARLDFYRFGGDSLQGRYHYLRLHPLSVAELHMDKSSDLQSLLMLSGFPEPFFEGDQTQALRWSQEYRTRLLQEDVTRIEQIHDLGQLELLIMRLPELVGSPLSINGLREDLQASHKTVSRWLDILERFYAIFRIPPFGSPLLRAVKKERKHYHLDWSLVPTMPERFENLVAAHLLKWIHFEIDTKGRALELRYFRDIDKREVDFVLIENKKPIQFIECKWADAAINPALHYLKSRYKECDAWQISATGKKDYRSPEGIRVCPAVPFLADLI